jgi:hypothetical protein
MAAWRQDLTYAFRRLSKSPGFAAAAVFAIALGIAANSTIFSMVSRFVLRPAPVGESGHINEERPSANFRMVGDSIRT